jgi:two-component system response regulator GlrR
MTRRLLVVDDEAGILFAISDYLHTHGYEVDSVPTLAEAKTHLDRRGYTAVIADVCLTTHQFGTEGLEVASYARERYPEIPVLLFTAHNHAHIDREARRLGVAAVFDKPLRLEVLAQIIDRLSGGAP